MPTDPAACMTAAIYYEAARESDEGQKAVARVVLNRLADAAYPKSVCAVIFQGHERRTGCQFTFTCDGALANTPDPALWARAGMVAAAALGTPEGLPRLAATNYHADYVRPLWAGAMHRETQIGRHVFYTRRPNTGYSAGTISGVQPDAAAPGPTTFSPWGLPIARLVPASGGGVTVTVTEAPTGLLTGG